MKITFGKYDLKFKYAYLVSIVIIFFTDGLFLDLIYGLPVEGEETPPGPEKMIIMSGFVISALHINKFPSFLRNYLIICYLFFLALVLESYYRSGSFFQYPHVFSKMMVMFLAFGILPYFKEMKPDHLINVMYIIIVAFVVNLFTLRPEILSFAAFIEIDRGFAAASTYMLLLPCIYFFNKYLFSKNIYHLLLFFGLIGMIIFLQHRTVWLAMIFAFFINFLLLRKANTTVPPSTLTPIFVIPAIAFFLLFSFVLSTNPEIIEKFVERIEDIQNADSQGTGSWRLQQFMSYLPYIQDHPVFGMRLDGFELPIQFFHEEAGTAFFEDGTGHHFHSFYVDRLFYFGLFGLIIIIFPFLYLIKFATSKSSFTLEEVVMVSFSLSGIVYGISYNLPVFFFGIIGMTLGVIEARSSLVEKFNTSDKYENNEKKLILSGKYYR